MDGQRIFYLPVTEEHCRVITDLLTLNAPETEDLVMAAYDVIREAKAERVIAAASEIVAAPKEPKKRKPFVVKRREVHVEEAQEDGEQ